MKKVFKVISFVIMFVFLFTVSAMARDNATIGVSIDGEKVVFNDSYGYPFIDSNNRTLVPFRITLEKAGATVSWDNNSKTAKAEKDGITVLVTIGKNFIIVNNEVKKIDTSAVIKDGRTYLPIRAVLEAFNYSITWNSWTSTVLADFVESVSDDEIYDYEQLYKLTPFTIGGGLRKSWNEFGEYLIYFEKFLEKHPNSPLINQLQTHFNIAINSYMFGLRSDLTYNDNKKYYEDVIDSYYYIIINYKDSNTAKLLKDFLKILEDNEYCYTEEVLNKGALLTSFYFYDLETYDMLYGIWTSERFEYTFYGDKYNLMQIGYDYPVGEYSIHDDLLTFDDGSSFKYTLIGNELTFYHDEEVEKCYRRK